MDRITNPMSKLHENIVGERETVEWKHLSYRLDNACSYRLITFRGTGI